MHLMTTEVTTYPLGHRCNASTSLTEARVAKRQGQRDIEMRGMNKSRKVDTERRMRISKGDKMREK